DPVLPADLTRLNDQELGRLHSEFVCMAQYAKHIVAMRSIERTIARRREKIVRAQVRLKKQGSHHDRAAMVEVDNETVSSSFSATVAEGAELLTNAMFEGYI